MTRVNYSSDPTANADERAEQLREWYEKNRETWWDRCSYSQNQRLLNAGCSDDFMLELQRKAVEIAIAAGQVVYKEER